MYQLYYWPSIAGRGEIIRLAFEEGGAAYVDVARKDGAAAIMRFLSGEEAGPLAFAPPIVRTGKLVLAQTANILQYIGTRHGLAPEDEAERTQVQQLQLTVLDVMDEVHDCHHPIAGSLYYEDQREEAKRRSAIFTRERLPKLCSYFERVLARSGGDWLVGSARSYADLSLFQVLAGLDYAFPRAMKRIEIPRLRALGERVAALPRIAAYRSSDRHVPFNQEGIFRHYEELDA